MSQQLINLNEDLRKLRDDGYEVKIVGNKLIVENIPYVNSDREISFGTLVSELTLQGNKTQKPGSHVMSFAGNHPCHQDGSIILAIQHSNSQVTHEGGITTNFTFSNKPSAGYSNYYEKFVRYIDIISGPAKSLDPSVSAQTYRPVVDEDNGSVFEFLDSHSSRLNLFALNEKIRTQKIAIVGVGGTGSYILDFVSKTPVAEIHIFDGDQFLQHNAFRSPGPTSLKDLEESKNKAVRLQEKYSLFRKQIIAHPEMISKGNMDTLIAMDFVFLAIDGSARETIVHFLADNKVLFIDVGIGLERVDDTLLGAARVTVGAPQKYQAAEKYLPFHDHADNEYNTNYQICELNALNAALAVIKWKKLCKFYHDSNDFVNEVYTLDFDSLLTNEN